MNLDEWTDDDIRQWLLLRAIEWTNWPAFLSQLLSPLFLVAAWWPVVIVGVLEIIRK
jgi:kynureninase